MSNDSPEVRNMAFFVDTTPYCLWDTEPASKNVEMVRGLRPDYFSYVARIVAPALASGQQDAPSAAMALRIAYGHAAETVVALIFASIQAPHCLYAWLDRYKISDLVSLCGKIESSEGFPTMLAEPVNDWASVAQHIFSNAPTTLTSTEGAQADISVVRAGVASALQNIAADLCRDDSRAEYNSYKHGLRVALAGIEVTIWPKDKPPIQVPGSAFGSVVMSTVQARGGDRINLGLERRVTNWDPVQLARRLHVAVACLDCIKSYLLQELTLGKEKVQWRFFASENAYVTPWAGGPRLMSGKFRSLQFPQQFEGATAEEVHSVYNWPSQKRPR